MTSSPFYLTAVLVPSSGLVNATATATETGSAGNETAGISPTGNVLSGDPGAVSTVEVQVWLNADSNAESVDLTLDYNTTLGTYISATGPSGWENLNNPSTPGVVLLSGFDSSFVNPIATVSNGLVATFDFTPATSATSFTATLAAADFSDINNNSYTPSLPGELTVPIPDLTITGVAAATGTNETAGTVGSPLVGKYGTLTLNADGSYQYLVNQSDPAVQALGFGQFVTDTFTYTVSDVAPQTQTETLTVTIDGAPCFHAGTRIDTPSGPVPVERVVVGDLVTTISGEAKPVIWAGSRHVDCSRHPRPKQVWPFRVRAGACGPGMPGRDLILSPDHAIFINGVLIPVKYLANGTTIFQEQASEAYYFHIELERHDVVLAEGLPTETYLDTGDRARFAQFASHLDLYPDFSTRIWEAEGYAPLCVVGPEVEVARRHLAHHVPAALNIGTRPFASAN